jgi:25S rRNA (uracil2843-N3)-methyltransferase
VKQKEVKKPAHSANSVPAAAKTTTRNNTKSQGEPDGQLQLTPSSPDRKQQQRVLDVFRHAFSDTLASPNFTAALQSVKQALYDRDFARAFNNPESLAVYAARWSPTRALCYASVLTGIQKHLELLFTSQGDDDGDGEHEATPESPPQQLHVLSIGGGAAELVALSAFLNANPSLSGAITLLDSGPWATVVTQLTTALTTPPPISKYASAAAKQANTAFVPASHLHPTFLQRDALTLTQAELTSLLGGPTATATPRLITLLFTLNELFTAGGIGKTTAFLLALTAAAPAGSLLLVVDSPGSYSEASVGGGGSDKRRYPMQWLLDRILLGTRREPVVGDEPPGTCWAKLESRDSEWFRLPEGGAGQQQQRLEYPIALENMRFQMHLYRAERASSQGSEDREADGE